MADDPDNKERSTEYTAIAVLAGALIAFSVVTVVNIALLVWHMFLQ